MFRFLFFILILTIYSFSVSAQVNSVQLDGNQQMNFILFDEDNQLDDYEGSPYTIKDFISAKINDSDKTYFVRYNAAEDQMEIKIDSNGSITLLDNSSVKYSILLEGIERKYATITYDNGARGYALVVWKNEDGASLYKKEVVKFIPSVVAQNGYQKNRSARYERKKDVYFIQLPGKEKVIEAPDNRRKLIALFPDSDLKNFMRSNKFYPDKEEHLIAILKHILK